MILFFGIISTLIYLCRKYKLYILLILPIFLIINYIVTCLICFSDFFQDHLLLNTIFNLSGFQDFQRSNFDFSLVNKIFLSISSFYLQFFVLAILLKKATSIKSISKNIVFNTDKIIKNIFNKKDRFIRTDVIKYLEILLATLLIIHAFSFYTSEYVFIHYQYLFSKAEEFYYFFPKLSAQIAKIFPIIYFALIGINLFKNEFNIFKNKFLIFLFFHGFLWFYSINSRWIFAWAISIFSILCIYIFRSKISNFSKIIYIFFTSSVGIYSSMFLFQKVLFTRTKVSGLGTIFSFGLDQFDFLYIIKGFSIINLSSAIFIYSGIEQNLKTSTLYNLLSLSPLPSFFHGLDKFYFRTISRVSIYAPSPSYLQMYQNNYFYSAVIIVLFAIFLSIIILIKNFIIKFNLNSNKTKIYSYLTELAILIPLIYGFQYQVRTMMRYYWFGIFIVFLPLLFKPLIKDELNK